MAPWFSSETHHTLSIEVEKQDWELLKTLGRQDWHRGLSSHRTQGWQQVVDRFHEDRLCITNTRNKWWLQWAVDPTANGHMLTPLPRKCYLEWIPCPGQCQSTMLISMFFRFFSTLLLSSFSNYFSFQTNFRPITITPIISVIMTFLYVVRLPNLAMTQLIMNLWLSGRHFKTTFSQFQ